LPPIELDAASFRILLNHLRELQRLERGFGIAARAEHWDAAGAISARRIQVIHLICDWMLLHDQWGEEDE